MRARIDHDPSDLPEARSATAGEAAWDLHLEAITPIYKGGAKQDRIDEARPFRAPSIRGQLRYWWRATSEHTDTDVLRSAEEALFGGVFGEKMVASKVRVGVTNQRSNAGKKPGRLGYITWVDRVADDGPPQYHDPGAHAQLRVTAPTVHRDAVARALSAWALFGGIGSRTRRGMGAVRIDDPTLQPAFADARALAKHFASLAPAGGARPWPTLAGARLFAGKPCSDAMAAWKHAVDAMQTVRQYRGGRFGTTPLKLDNPPPWHDMDYVDIRAGRRFDSERAALGLPIQFQSNGFRATMGPDGKNRVPSPIVVRPVPLAHGVLPVMLAFTGPYPRNSSLKAGRGLSGKLNPKGVDRFLDALVRIDGWSMVSGGSA